MTATLQMRYAPNNFFSAPKLKLRMASPNKISGRIRTLRSTFFLLRIISPQLRSKFVRIKVNRTKLLTSDGSYSEDRETNFGAVVLRMNFIRTSIYFGGISSEVCWLYNRILVRIKYIRMDVVRIKKLRKKECWSYRAGRALIIAYKKMKIIIIEKNKIPKTINNILYFILYIIACIQCIYILL